MRVFTRVPRDTCGDGIDQDCNGSDLVDLTKDSDNDGLTDYEEENTYFTDPEPGRHGWGWVLGW